MQKPHTHNHQQNQDKQQPNDQPDQKLVTAKSECYEQNEQHNTAEEECH